jgi:threonine dehydrogenase-like Zn-dependent dehydrogenase
MGSRNALPEDFLEVIRMLESGNFPVEETISIVVPSEAAPGILADWSAAHAKYTKIIVQMY